MTVSNAPIAMNFASIPSGIRKPGDYLEFNTSNAINGLPADVQNVLIVGQMLATGSVAPNTLQNIYSTSQAAVFFGAGSIAHLMCVAALTANNLINLQAIALADAASGAIKTIFSASLAGTSAGQAGNYTINIGSQSAVVTVNQGDTPTIIAANMAAQLALMPNLPVTATASAGVITLTAKNAGTLGNQLVLSSSLLNGIMPITGVTSTLAAVTSGMTDPAISTALTTVFSSGVDVVITAWNDQANLTALDNWLAQVSSAIEKRGAIGVTACNGSLSSATTLAATQNNGRLTQALLRGALNQSYEIAAAYGAELALNTDPAMPYNDLPLIGIVAPPQNQWLSRTEQEICLANGVTPLQVGPGQVVQIVRAISTYTLNSAGIPDVSLLDITTIRTLDYVRQAIDIRYRLRFSQCKLIDNITPGLVRSEILDVLYELEALQIVQNVTANAPQLIIQPNLTDPTRLDAQIPANIVTGLQIFAGVIDLYLG